MRSTVKCLLVDDLEENLLALSALLQEDGVELLQARSAAAALELLLLQDVALAFLDVQMPETDGFQLAELMRGSARTRHVPIIFVTADPHDRHRLFEGYEKGAVDFLYKPLDPGIVRNKAGVFFQLHRQKQQLAQELVEKTETLRLNEMLTAVLGHDLRNPLSVVLGSAYLLQRNPEANVRTAAERIVSSGKRMQRMIEDMLDLARVRLAGGIPIERSDTDLGILVRGVVQEYQATLPQLCVELSQEGGLRGEWDADRLIQAVTNLLGNAAQHGEPDKPIRIRLDGTDADSVTLSIINAGGIAPEVLPHIFDPFRSGRQHADRTGGIGLGLYIVQQIVIAHRGTIVVNPDAVAAAPAAAQETSTMFQIRIPRQAQQSVSS